jgi:hypothetical protein
MYRDFVAQLKSQGVELPAYLLQRDRKLAQSMRERAV